MLVAGDGEAGVPDRAPFDRIIATCAVPAVPAEWVRQLRSGGRLVADIRAATSSALITAQRKETGELVGRFHAVPGHFMWLRPRADVPLPRHGGEGDMTFDRTALRNTDLGLDPAVLDDPEFGFQLALRVPGIVQSLRRPDRGTRILRTSDGSWSEIDGSGSASQSGPRSVGDEIADAYRAWTALDQPRRSDYGLTVTSDGTTTIWRGSADEPRIGTSPCTGLPVVSVGRTVTTEDVHALDDDC